MVKRLPAMWETRVRSLGREDPREKAMAIHSSTLAWKIPWKEEPDRLQSMGSQRVGYNWATSLTHSLTHSRICLFLPNLVSFPVLQVSDGQSVSTEDLIPKDKNLKYRNLKTRFFCFLQICIVYSPTLCFWIMLVSPRRTLCQNVFSVREKLEFPLLLPHVQVIYLGVPLRSRIMY